MRNGALSAAAAVSVVAFLALSALARADSQTAALLGLQAKEDADGNTSV